MNSDPARPLIIGYGNPIRTDDSIGLHVARAAAAVGFDAMEEVQLVPEMAERIAASPIVVFIDCDSMLEPGEIEVRPVDPDMAPWHALHEFAAPETLLKLARDVYGHAPAGFFIGVGPESLDVGDVLSATAAAAIPLVLRLCDECVRAATSTPAPPRADASARR